MIEAIIFDFDGVLFDSEPYHIASTQMVLQELNIALTHDLYQEQFMGHADHHTFKALLQAHGHDHSPASVAQLIKNKINAYRLLIEKQNELNALDGALHFLQHVSKKLNKFAVYSNGNRSDIDLVLNKLEGGALAKFFQFTITVNDVTEGKPAPEGYLQAAKRLGVKPEHCLVIEDSLTGMTAAKRSGAQVVGLTTTYSRAELQTLQPVFIADSYAEIERWLSSKC